jgi:maltose/moltooligosaccharide transporter
MGIFNLFIVIPQVAATLGLGAAMEHLLNNDPLQAVVAGGVCFIIAALLTLRVRMEPRNPEAASARLGGSH